jgi:hypothetical protein
MSIQSIRYLRRGEIDTARWDQCIDAASNGLIYAYSFYLDHMSRHWDALVMNDYEAVMPLTCNKKFGIHYLYQPAFTAALGVFGKNLHKELVQQMLDAIPAKFRLIEIELNQQNKFDLPMRPQRYTDDESFAAAEKAGRFVFYERTNFVLDLSRPYAALYLGYRENLQRILKKSAGTGLQYTTGIQVGEVLKLAQSQLQLVSNYTEKDFKNFNSLFRILSAKQQALTCGVYNSANELLASAVFFFSHNRAYYILVGNRLNGTEGASHYLFDRFIHDHAGKKLLLDFEGSDIRGLAYFYSSFGATEEKYCSARANRLPWIIKLLKAKT